MYYFDLLLCDRVIDRDVRVGGGVDVERRMEEGETGDDDVDVRESILLFFIFVVDVALLLQ